MSVRTKLIQTNEGYTLYRVIGKGRGKLGKKNSLREWFLIKQSDKNTAKMTTTIYYPLKLIGKKARIKIEIE